MMYGDASVRGRPSAAEFEANLRRQAARTLVELFDSLYEGAFAVDARGRVVWMNDKFKALLGWNGVEPVEWLPVEEVIPSSRMREVVETGRADLLDIIALGERQLVVSRLPLQDEAGRVTGAMGVILYDRIQALGPLVGRFQALRQDLAQAQRDLAESRRAKYGFQHFAGASPAALALKREARRAAERDAPVLLLGETGTGKELLAHAIHAASPRAARPMVRVNVAALPESLIEAELFGHAAGAFTGADRKGREGKFQLADGGTLFLDEVGDLPLALQPKLLRALEEQEIEPLGSNRVRQVDVRVIAATSRDLRRMAEAGAFRPDLYYRLSVLPLHVPPLRERLDDIPVLVEALLDEMRVHGRAAPPGMEFAALERLAMHDWPGNVRELRNVLEQAAARAEPGETIGPEHLTGLGDARPEAPPVHSAEAASGPAAPGTAVRPLREVLAEAERRAIQQALDAAGGVKIQAARLLGISRAQLYEKLASLGLAEPAAPVRGAVRIPGQD
jgi:transcriptional regulator with PAS, ATPase and Fis domain